MRSQGLLAVPVALALLLGGCTSGSPGLEPLPTEWPELAEIDGVLDLRVSRSSGELTVFAQLDDRADPADAAQTATELRDTADQLAPLADGYALVLVVVRPGDFPPSATGWWRDGTQDDPRFEGLVATLAAFELPEPATKVAIAAAEGFSGTYEAWTIESYLDVDDATTEALRAALADTADAHGVPVQDGIEVKREFPGQ